MRQFMLESVKYWIDEFHIDGFRFDLMGVHDIETMQAIREMVNRIDPSIYIYGEGWSAGSCAYPTEKLAMKAMVTYNRNSCFHWILVDFSVDFSRQPARQPPYFRSEYAKEKGSIIIRLPSLFISRGDWIRTSDHTPPRRVL